MKIRLSALLLCLAFLLSGCTFINLQSLVTDDGTTHIPSESEDRTSSAQKGENTPNPENPSYESASKGEVADLGDADRTFGAALEELGAYDGYFEGESKDFSVECLSGTASAFKLEGTTLTFTSVSEDSVYAISGSFRGNVVIDTGNAYKFDLELCGFSLVCSTANPITIHSGKEVAIKAKKDTKNYIYDLRTAVDSAADGVHSGAIYAETDLEIGGKGALTLISENNNGIHTKDDLQIKNLTLLVACIDNALKGNDSVTVEGGNTTLIASGGDCIKTANSGLSEKGNQRGSIAVIGGTHTLYAACDGIDAAYNVTIDDAATVLNIYTDKYSNYSSEVTKPSSDVNYIRYSGNKYYYSVKYYNSDTDYLFVNAEYHSKVTGGRTTYYYYSYPTLSNYAKVQFFVYESASKQGQEANYIVKSDYLTPNSGCDTLALSVRGSQWSYSWTNYSTGANDGGFGGGFGGGPGGGGFGDGNSDKGDHSTKGIKAANEIVIKGGRVSVKAYDDALHAGDDQTLENGSAPLGNVTVSGGTLTLYSNDDGIHADKLLTIKGGTVSVINAYEGLEGAQVQISGGYVSVNSKDDGINATTSSGTAISISGGTIYIYCTGDGIDSNSRTANVGIVFTGGKTVVISNSGMNSSLDTENGYTYTAGSVIAIMPKGGMSNESTHCDNFSSIGSSKQLSLTAGNYLVVGIRNANATVKMPLSMSALVVVLGDNSPTVTSAASTSQALDENGVAWH